MKRKIKADAEFVAEIIFRDLFPFGTRPSLALIIDLCEKHGATVIISRKIKPRWAGFYWDEAIFLTAHIGNRELAGVALHELVHHLALCSPRYEHLNSEFEDCGYDRREFNEYLARAVERLWLKIGGSTWRTHRLDD